MVGFGGDFQHFELDIGAHQGKDVVALGANRLGRRLGQRRILLERFMIRFHVPPFAVDGGYRRR